jgi:ribose transport system permease protein
VPPETLSGDAAAASETPALERTVNKSRSTRLPDFRFHSLSGLYLIVALGIIYSLIEPANFLTLTNLRATLANEAITGLVALGLIVSLTAGVFDLSIAANMSWSIMFLGWLQSTGHVEWMTSVVLVLLSGAVIGILNAVIVTKLKVDSVIGTLAMSTILEGLEFWRTGGQSIVTGINHTFINVGAYRIGTIALPVFLLVVVALILWYLLEHTPAGRYLYAVGSNPIAARLAGIRVVRIQWLGLVTSALVASFAGIVFTAQLGTASFDAGSPYLLPAFAAAFLGATQIRPGRFNVWGTVVAIYLLAVGVKGLTLRYPSAPWITDVFEGAVLVLAVATAGRSARRRVVQG